MANDTNSPETAQGKRSAIDAKEASDICHATADALKDVGEVLPRPVGRVVQAAGSVVKVVCTVMDAVHEDKPKAMSEEAPVFEVLVDGGAQ